MKSKQQLPNKMLTEMQEKAKENVKLNFAMTVLNISSIALLTAAGIKQSKNKNDKAIVPLLGAAIICTASSWICFFKEKKDGPEVTKFKEKLRKDRVVFMKKAEKLNKKAS